LHNYSIGERAFYKCSQLQKISICSVYPPNLGEEVFLDTPEDKKFEVLEEYIVNYQNSLSWQTFNLFGISECGTSDIITHELAGVSIYPNPSNGQVFIENTSEFNLAFELYNTNGALELIQEIENQDKLIISDLKPGIHFYIVTGNSKRKTGKLIISE
jgi:hypothetical protein